jgi:cytidylate kinase|tara:strand:+ start:83 stop:772 length:690 start_codon:yes stop_codon:yes gene_type:complete
MKNITIAIDGHASTGKSSIAKVLASKYGYIYINSGSMYRAVTLFIIENNLFMLAKNNINLFIKKLRQISINFKFNDNNLISEIYLNSRNIENEIGEMQVSKLVSEVAAIPEIRKEMVKLQRTIDREKGVIMDGRDIGSVVFPDADLKLFLTASDSVRAKRRFEEMLNKGLKVSYDEILCNIKNRDMLDSTRSDSPLIIEKDAIVIDNSNMSIDDQIDKISQLIEEKISN